MHLVPVGAEISGPMWVSGSIGSPTLMPFSISRSASIASSRRLRSTYTRVAAVQSCPVLYVAPRVTARAISEMSASVKTNAGALPPSSRWTRFKLFGRALHHPPPGRCRPRETDHVNPVVGDQRLPDLCVASDHAERPGRGTGLLQKASQQHRCSAASVARA